MKVSIDEQVFIYQRAGGISRYFTELVREFRRHREFRVEPVLPFRWTANIHAQEAGIARGVPGRLRKAPLLTAANLPFRISERHADLVHHTFYDPRRVGRLDGGKPQVVTVYDMIPELMPEMFVGGNPHLAKKDYVARADLILCISEQTRRDLIRCYGPPAGHVAVTRLGVDRAFRPDRRPLKGWPSLYVLFVGGRSSYKDFQLLARAFASVAADFPHVDLVAAGGGPFTAAEKALFQQLGVSGRVTQSGLDEPGLVRAYANAVLFVFPSRYEGFGLPTLEAMASGCPSLLANSSSHPEVGGAAAAYFDPGDAHSLAEKLGSLLDDPCARADLVARGFDRAKRFTWAETARRTAGAYEHLLNS